MFYSEWYTFYTIQPEAKNITKTKKRREKDFMKKE